VIRSTHFAIVPEWLLDEASPRAVVLYAMLRRYSGQSGCYPKRRTLWERLGVTESTLDRLVKELVTLEAVQVVPRFGPDGNRTSNEYLLADAKGVYPKSAEGGPRADMGGVPASEGVAEREPLNERKTSTPPSLALVGTYVPYAHPFDAFWEAYPRRNGKRVLKADAVKVWAKMTPKERDLAMASVGHYRSACDSGLTIACDAVRWLRRKSWEDWDTPAVDDRERPKEESWAQAQSRLIQERGF